MSEKPSQAAFQKQAIRIPHDDNFTWGTWKIGGDGSILLSCPECGSACELGRKDLQIVHGVAYTKAAVVCICGYSRNAALMEWNRR